MRTVRGALPGRLHFDATGGTRLDLSRRGIGARSLCRARHSAGAQRAHRQARGPCRGQCLAESRAAAGGRGGGPCAGTRAARDADSRKELMSTRRSRRAAPVLLLSLFVSLLEASVAMSQTSPNDFSERLDKLWEFSKPAESETRFRAELARHPHGFARGPRDLDADRAHAEPSAAIRRRRCDTGHRRAEAGPGAGARAHPLFAGTGPHAQLRRRQARGDCRCSRTPSRCRIAIRCPARISTASTRCTCWASRHLQPSNSTGTARRWPWRKAPPTRARAAGPHRSTTTSAGPISTRATPSRRSSIGRKRCRCARRKATRRTSGSPSGRSRAGIAPRASSTMPRRCSWPSSPKPRRPANPTATSTRSSRKSPSRVATRARRRRGRPRPTRC